MKELRQKISKIMNSKEYSEKEKNELIFNLMNPQKRIIKNKRLNFNYTLKGCKHYNRGCLVKAECCGYYVPCRLCHDDELDHKINRYITKYMKCKYCDTEQEVNKNCIFCKEIMGEYYCNICKLWSNAKDKPIFHCKDCNICRIGKREDYFHCNKCSSCIKIELAENHNCIENALKTDCAICNEDLFNSVSEISLLRCGHYIHQGCLKEYVENNNYNCPICKKSIIEMDNYWNQIDIFLKDQIMPIQFNYTYCLVYCNDCEKKSYSNYHFIYNKCYFCKGYNTHIDKTIDMVENIEKIKYLQKYIKKRYKKIISKYIPQYI